MFKFQDMAKAKNQMLQVTSVTTGETVEFPAFITRFTDNFQVSWGTEGSFGRIDPVKPYIGTTRRIALGLTVLSPDIEMARRNLANYSKFIQMLYPVYSAPLADSGAKSLGRTIKAPPILKIKLMNYIQSPSGGDGLLGCIDGLDFSPDFDSGHFMEENGEILPVQFNFSFNFEPQHDEDLGYGEEGFLSSNFPYGRPQASVISAASSTGENAVALQDAALLGE